MNPAIIYGAIGAVVASFLLGFGSGWKWRNDDYMAFKQSVAIEAEKQTAKVESINKQSDLISKGIKNEYEAKLSAIRNFYAAGVRNSSSGAMPTIPTAPISFNAESTYPILIGQCAETTQQLVSLQSWIKEQAGLQ